jgi:hypothetical protein
LTDALTSIEYDDAIGPITRNVADGLFAIAAALERIARVGEEQLQMRERASQINAQQHEEVQAMLNEMFSGPRRGGHA